MACDLLPPPAYAPFKQLIRQQMVQLQNSISKHLHHYILSSMLFDETFKAHHAQILSCFGPGASTWLTTRLIFPTFWLSSPIFFTTLHTRLGLPHPSIAGILQCVCTHPIDPMGIHLLHYVHNKKRTKTHDAIRAPLPPLREMLVSTWDQNNYMCFLQPHSTPLINESTLCLPKMAFAP